VRSLRLYIEKPLDEGFKVLLKDDSFHYLSKVLKAKVNQEVVLFNNTGYDFFGYIKDIAAKHFEIYIEHKVFSEKEVFNTELAFSLCKNPCSDLIIKKLTELGVTSLQPLISKNSIFNHKKLDFEKKFNHWKSISISSCEQSERSYLPDIKKIISFQDYIKNCKSEKKIILDTKSKDMINNLYNKPFCSTSILVGPEGDFSQDEYLYAKQSNFSSVSLGDNILRVETAAIAAISYIKIINNSKNL
tara:strand:+ start:19 stop:753 length:735 start_codon:yes stop_codon:yes gene_type:complete